MRMSKGSATTSVPEEKRKSCIRRDDDRVYGLVLARGGSVGIAKKNVRVVAGFPLLSWVLRPMRKCTRFSSIWVSTDCEEIGEVAQSCGAEIHFRDPISATHKSSSLSAVQDFISHHKEATVVGLVQCTSPCLLPEQLEKACSMILDDDYDSVFSVHRQHKLRWKEVEPYENTYALNFDPHKRPRRQDWKGELVESGHFYFARVHLIEKGLLQGGRCGFVEMPAQMCFEIDDEKDLLIAESLLKVYGYKD